MCVSGLCTSVPIPDSAVADTPQSTLTVSCETATQSSVFFSRQGEESERSGITLPDTRGWSARVTSGSGVTLSLRVGISLREALRRA